MNKQSILFNLQKNDEYYTPIEILKLFGNFDYDPCTTNRIAGYHNIPRFDDKLTNGLLSNWSKYKRIWINPPFSNKKEFLQKAVETYNQIRNEIYILIPLSYLGTKEFHNIVKTCHIFLFKKRINFLNGKSNSPFPSVVIKLKASNTWEVINNG